MVNGYIVELEQDFVLFKKIVRNLISNGHNCLEILVDVALLEPCTNSLDTNLFDFGLWL